MTSYYYTCPIKALYMMKEFGVKFYNRTLICVEGVEDYPELSMCFKDTEREINQFGNILVKESEHIFEPQENDVDNEGYIYGKTNIINTMTSKFDYSVEGWVKCVDDCYNQKNFSKTYIRNGKHFFMPEEEK